MKILFFGKFRELASSIEMEHPTPTEGIELIHLIDHLERKLGLEGIFKAHSTLIALNQDMLVRGANPRLFDNDEVAFMPPLSGG